MNHVRINDVQDDFVFIVGDERHRCPPIISEILSPRIGILRCIDASTAEYVVETKDLEHQFRLFLSLGQGSAIRVNRRNCGLFLRLSAELGNSAFCESVLDQLHGIFPARLIFQLCGDFSIRHLAARFHEIQPSTLDTIPVSALFDILSHNSLKLSNEDSLCSYLINKLYEDPEYLELLQFVRFEYVSRRTFSAFLGVIPHWIDSRLWDSLSPRLASRVRCELEFPLDDSKALEGIIWYLTQKHGGNVHDRGVVSITAKSVDDDPRFPMRNVADLTTGSYFWSKNSPGQWVCWDFRQMQIRPTRYTIRGALKSWHVESSLDGVEWTEIDRKIDNWATSFPLSRVAKCRFIRLTQTGTSGVGNDQLGIYAFEVFGTLLEWRE
jgi:hypothetical protein